MSDTVHSVHAIYLPRVTTAYEVRNSIISTLQMKKPRPMESDSVSRIVLLMVHLIRTW